MRLITAINALPPGRRRALAQVLKAIVNDMDLADGPVGFFFEEAPAVAAPKRRQA
jgi:hypothetical protein